ncbi:MAG: pyridoxamine 5'-phosphate oxidase family protein [Gammaproteobacteria bacterium]|nr:pyridoxamine 5'-phosphate oxidase family protein [Gammaproteobacteria bacterium]
MSTAYPWVEPPWPQKALPRARLEDRIGQLLGSTNMGTLATVDAAGQPIASPIEYYADGLTLYLLPDPGTPKLRAMQHDPRVCFAVHGAYHGWHSARGAQVFGRATIIAPHAPGWKRGMAVFRWYEWMHDLGLDTSKPFERPVCRIDPVKILYTETWLWKLGYGAKQRWEARPATVRRKRAAPRRQR